VEVPPGSAGASANAVGLPDDPVSTPEREAGCAGAAARADRPRSRPGAAENAARAPPGAAAPDPAVPCPPAAQLAAAAVLRREAAAKRAAMRGAGEAAADLAAADADEAPPAAAGGPRGAGPGAPAPVRAPGACAGEPARPNAPRAPGSARAMALRYRAGQKAAVAAVRAALGAHAGRVAAAAADAAARVWRPAEEPDGPIAGDPDAASDAADGWGAELARMGVTCPRAREVCPHGRATVAPPASHARAAMLPVRCASRRAPPANAPAPRLPLVWSRCRALTCQSKPVSTAYKYTLKTR